jgi:glycosyltransferase involved in cell wall biosynthesis
MGSATPRIDLRHALEKQSTLIEAHQSGAEGETAAGHPIRIAIVISHPIQHFAPLHRKLASLTDVELKVFFCADWGARPHLDPDFGIEVKWDIPLLDGYAWEFLPGKQDVNWLGFRGCDNPSISSALDGYRPDVVQVVGYAHRTMWRTVGWCRKNRIPVLLGSDSNAGAHRPFWKRLAKRIVVGAFYRKVDGAFFVGDNNYAYHSRYGIPKDRLFPGALPIDQQRLTISAGDRSLARREIRSKHGIPPDAFVAVFSGKLSARKSPAHLLNAARRCSDQGTRIWALFAGEGSERKCLEDLVDNLQIRNAVFAGFVNQSLIAKYYAASDVLVVPSAYDPHPLVLPEAGCFGIPVIASDRIGCIGESDTARVGVNALVYPYGDIEELASCLMRLYEDQELYIAMSEAARNIAGSQDVGPTALKLREAAKQLTVLGCRH